MVVYKDEKTWTVQCRIKNRDGTTKQHKKRGFLTKKEAKEYESKITSKVPKCHMKSSEFYEIYLLDKKNELKYRTILTKRQMIETHILPYFGELPLDEITAEDIQYWQNQMYEKNYEPTYLRSIANQLSGMMNHACNIYGMQTSPYRKIRKMGKADANRIDFWTFDEYQRFIQEMKDDPVYFPLFETLYYTGMREGELLALSKDMIDFDNNVIHIRKTFFRRYKVDHITEPKTENSIRDIVIPQFLADELKEYISHCYRFADDERIFKMTAEAVQHKMKNAIKRLGLKMIRVHSLRHSHVAFLINRGVQPLEIKERLGHRDIKVTLNTYGHLYPNAQKKVADLLDMEYKKTPTNTND